MSDLARAISTLCDDLLFGVVAAESLDDGPLDEWSKKRAPIYLEVARGGAVASFAPAPVSWALGLLKEAASVASPRWMPMHEVVNGGVSLAGGARGMRSLFSSKPSEKEVARVKRLGALAFKVLGAVVASDGAPSADEQAMLHALLSSLGLPPEEESLLLAAPLGDATAVEILGDLEPKIAAQALRGAWQAALRDGLDPREEGALATLASRLSIKPEEAASHRAEAAASVEARRLLGRSTIDALYWLLGDEVASACAASVAVASLLLPEPERASVLAALAAGAPPASVNRATLAKPARTAALAACWLVALRTNPTLARKATLAARLDTIAKALEGDGPKVRSSVEELFDKRLHEAAVALASP